MEKKSGSSIGGLLFAGCMFIGAGIGMAYDATRVGGALGMGVGFIAMAITWIIYRNQE